MEWTLQITGKVQIDRDSRWNYYLRMSSNWPIIWNHNNYKSTAKTISTLQISKFQKNWSIQTRFGHTQPINKISYYLCSKVLFSLKRSGRTCTTSSAGWTCNQTPGLRQRMPLRLFHQTSSNYAQPNRKLTRPSWASRTKTYGFWWPTSPRRWASLHKSSRSRPSHSSQWIWSRWWNATTRGSGSLRSWSAGRSQSSRSTRKDSPSSRRASRTSRHSMPTSTKGSALTTAVCITESMSFEGPSILAPLMRGLWGWSKIYIFELL